MRDLPCLLGSVEFSPVALVRADLGEMCRAVHGAGAAYNPLSTAGGSDKKGDDASVLSP